MGFFLLIMQIWLNHRLDDEKIILRLILHHFLAGVGFRCGFIRKQLLVNGLSSS
jgi:hypothetical protein